MISEGINLKEVYKSAINCCGMLRTNAENNKNTQQRKAIFSLGVKPRVSPNCDAQELQCPICLDPMYPPNLQCLNGHTLCSKCKSKVHNLCPTCQHDLNNTKCMALERVAQSLELPCKYKSQGCHQLFLFCEKLKHENLCKFRPYNCPDDETECPVTGDIPTLIKHLMGKHKVDVHVECTFNHHYIRYNAFKVENSAWLLTVFNCFSRYFCLHFEAFLMGTAPVYMAFLRFMGEPEEAKDFRYRLEVGRCGRKLIWEGVPRSIRDSHQRVRESSDGLVIPGHLALFFSGGERKDLKLKVAGHIWKEH